MNTCEKCKHCSSIPTYDGRDFVYECQKACTREVLKGFRVPTPCREIRNVVGDNCPEYDKSLWKTFLHWLFD